MTWILALLASVTPTQILLDAQAQDKGIATIAYRLQTAGVGLCRDTVPQSGLLLHDLSQYPASQRETAKALFGLQARPVVLAVVKGSAADTAGLRVGDTVLAIDGKPGDTAPGADTAIAKALQTAPAEIAIDRNGTSLSIDLSGRLGCASIVQVIPGNNVGASADGTYVQLTPPVIAAAKNDAELASIIAHEMAHNILRHSVWLTANGRSVRNILATEIDADRLSVHLVARAGYDPLAPAKFWAHFGRKRGYGVFSDGTHMRTKARVALLQAVAADVAAGKKFVPAQ